MLFLKHLPSLVTCGQRRKNRAFLRTFIKSLLKWKNLGNERGQTFLSPPVSGWILKILGQEVYPDASKGDCLLAAQTPARKGAFPSRLSTPCGHCLNEQALGTFSFLSFFFLPFFWGGDLSSLLILLKHEGCLKELQF